MCFVGRLDVRALCAMPNCCGCFMNKINDDDDDDDDIDDNDKGLCRIAGFDLPNPSVIQTLQGAKCGRFKLVE